MKISYNWLRQYIDTGKSPDEIANILTSIGLEVESIQAYESIRGGMEGLVIAEVITCSKHPDADKLSITTVDIGTGTLLNIVCGAPNVAAGQKVVVATVGTNLYIGNEILKIKKSKIRGAISEGMICAEDETGLGVSHEGIIVLDNNAKTGTPAKEYFKIENDTIFEIGLTPNRIDAASHYGVARDLAAFLSQDNKITLKRPIVNDFIADNHDYVVDVEIQDPEACYRYSGVTITGVKIMDSPQWLKNRLCSIGQKPINNVVDVTNFLLQETGQPLHAFDADEISGRKILVKTLAKGTKFTTLDGNERILSDKDLMICNSYEGMCIAGVFGGIKSGVTEKTTNIFLESACFNPRYIRNTSKHHQIFTDSSFRFERGSDPDITIYVLKRAVHLIQETAGGIVSSDIIDVYPVPVKQPVVQISFTNVDRLIGNTIDRNIIRKILNSLDISIISEHDDSLTLRIPNYRVDVKREADVIEEILRIYGYNYIHTDSNIKMPAVHSEKPDKLKFKEIIAGMLASNGFSEIMSNSITNGYYYKDSVSYMPERNVMLYNPLSSDLNAMRQNLLFGGLEAIIYNINRKVTNIRFFEFGKCYNLNRALVSCNPLEQYNEEQHLAVFISGKKSEANWNLKPETTDFYFLKSYVEKIMQRVGITTGSFTSTEISNDIFSFGISYSLNNMNLADFGAVHKNVLDGFNIDNPVFYAGFNWDNICTQAKNHKVAYSEIPRFPGVKRDLALVVDKKTSFEEIKKLAFKTEKKLLKKVSIFDIYEGEKISEYKKSYAVSFYLQDAEKTLTDHLIENVMQNIINTLNRELGATLR